MIIPSGNLWMFMVSVCRMSFKFEDAVLKLRLKLKLAPGMMRALGVGQVIASTTELCH
jgi:hypothetical protein